MKFTVSILIFATVLTITWASITTHFVPSNNAAIIRTPHYDSAIIHSDRIGPNFAYSTIHGHAYQAITPIQNALYHYTNGVPLTIPATQYVYLQNPYVTGILPEVPKEYKPTELETENVDDDTITIESA